MEYEPGDTIELTKNQRAIIDPIIKQARNAETAFKIAARWKNDSEINLWETLREIYPDLGKQYVFMYDDKEGLIRIMNKLDKEKIENGL